MPTPYPKNYVEFLAQAPPADMKPLVSIIVPCYNEEATILHLLEAIRAQTYPRDRLEVLIADGFSKDRTRAVIAGFQAANPDLAIAIIDNPRRTIPSALNQAIRKAAGEIIVRLDAHSAPYPDYVEYCAAALESGKGGNVGGIWEIRPGAQTWMAESIAAAAAHPLGVGDAQYRLRPKSGAVDTVPFGSFRKELVAKVGYFDERLLTNEDYEFNARIRRAGGIVWLDPLIRSTYYARASINQLAQQYWRYGFWKWRMLRRYPRSLRWRQALPPLFVASLVGTSVLSLWFSGARYALTAEVLIYLAVLALAGLRLALRQRQLFIFAGLPLAIAVMHLAWGAGFLWSMLANLFVTDAHD